MTSYVVTETSLSFDTLPLGNASAQHPRSAVCWSCVLDLDDAFQLRSLFRAPQCNAWPRTTICRVWTLPARPQWGRDMNLTSGAPYLDIKSFGSTLGPVIFRSCRIQHRPTSASTVCGLHPAQPQIAQLLPPIPKALITTP